MGGVILVELASHRRLLPVMVISNKFNLNDRALSLLCSAHLCFSKNNENENKKLNHQLVFKHNFNLLLLKVIRKII